MLALFGGKTGRRLMTGDSSGVGWFNDCMARIVLCDEGLFLGMLQYYRLASGLR